VLLWAGGTLVVATAIGSSLRTQDVLVPFFQDLLGLDDLWALRAHKAVRKAAHLLLYAGFAALVWWSLPPPRRRAAVAFGAAIALALVDEGVQALAPGRGASPWDVLLDAFGALVGLWAARRLLARREPAPPAPTGPS
jgi:VanZ family protein